MATHLLIAICSAVLTLNDTKYGWSYWSLATSFLSFVVLAGCVKLHWHIMNLVSDLAELEDKVKTMTDAIRRPDIAAAASSSLIKAYEELQFLQEKKQTCVLLFLLTEIFTCLSFLFFMLALMPPLHLFWVTFYAVALSFIVLHPYLWMSISPANPF